MAAPTGLDVLLQWYLRDVGPRFPDSPVLSADASGGRPHGGTIRNRLRHLLQVEGTDLCDRLSPHGAVPGVRNAEL